MNGILAGFEISALDFYRTNNSLKWIKEEKPQIKLQFFQGFGVTSSFLAKFGGLGSV